METIELTYKALVEKWNSLQDNDPEKEKVSRHLQSMGFVLCNGEWVNPGTNEC